MILSLRCVTTGPSASIRVGQTRSISNPHLELREEGPAPEECAQIEAVGRGAMLCGLRGGRRRHRQSRDPNRPASAMPLLPELDLSAAAERARAGGDP